MPPELFHAFYPVLTGLLSVLVAAFVAHRFSKQRDKEHEQWQRQEESMKREWEANQTRQRQEWELKQQERDEQVRKVFQANDQQWQEYKERERRQWEEAKGLLQEVKDSLSVKTAHTKTLEEDLKSSINLDHILRPGAPRIIKYAQRFAGLADLNAVSVCDMLLSEPITIDTTQFVKNLELQFDIKIDEPEAALTKLGLTRKGTGWTLPAAAAWDSATLDVTMLGDTK